MILAGTGHRPDKIRMGNLNAYDPTVFARLVDMAKAVIWQEEPDIVISGMALGWDMALAEAAIECAVPLHAYVPFVGQEGRWGQEHIKQYTELLELSYCVVVCDGGYAPWKLQKRNEAMVDNCDKVAALWNGDPSGGTANCIRYAVEQGRPIRNLWGSWTRYSGRETT